jgi:hypothetical protein
MLGAHKQSHTNAALLFQKPSYALSKEVKVKRVIYSINEI